MHQTEAFPIVISRMEEEQQATAKIRETHSHRRAALVQPDRGVGVSIWMDSSAATGNTSGRESSRDDEAGLFLNSFRDAGATGRRSSNEWSDEVEAFLNAHS
ncbi:hypothetical protein GJ744_011499 [Endocarpon pusillum]|uniref:Uncharacterized protein n=1 Tax=Endocarpon pusillum TaxID=364733 RepID=A0A8H7ACN8_9EURO|nr:hypothetical protein GJ744_011499 [Endocarpon pusillum]